MTSLWTELSLAGAPPRWTSAELSSARSAVQRTLATGALDNVGAALARVASSRLGRVLARALAGAEEITWMRILGDRYESLAHRVAPRGRVRARRLAAALQASDAAKRELPLHLAGWLRDGARREALADLVEGVLVHHRTPGRIA